MTKKPCLQKTMSLYQSSEHLELEVGSLYQSSVGPYHAQYGPLEKNSINTCIRAIQQG